MRKIVSPPRQQPPKIGGHRHGKNSGSTVLGIFIGLVVGILIAFGVVWYLNKTPLPFQDKSNRADKPAANGQAKTPESLPGKPGDAKLGEKPRFEFYKILPGGQEATPAPAPVPAPTSPVEAAPVAPGELLYLQAGAFQKAADADNLKAKLSLLGVEVGVQEVAIPEKGIMYRVRVGPYVKTDEMNRVRNQLAQNGIQATIVKVKEAQKN